MKLGWMGVFALALLVGACSSGTSGQGTNPPSGNDAGAPSAPVAAATETISVESQFGPVEGILEISGAPSAVPLAIIVSGSGSQDRDGNRVDGSGPANLRLLGEGLRASGIATLRFDDIGLGKNEAAIPANAEDLTYDMEVDVVLRWVDSLKDDPRFDEIVVVGHSQGALTAMLVAQKREVRVVSLAGAGRPLREVVLEQMKPQVTADQLSELDDALAKLEAGEIPGELAPPLSALLPVEVQPYMASWAKYDPKKEIAKVERPVLIVQGGTDAQVFLKDAELLEAAKADAELVVIDDMCHPLKQSTETEAKKQQKQYQDPSVPLHDALVPAIVAFVQQP
jgi:pimeloyl-ACP methyl ester carboxylesterase